MSEFTYAEFTPGSLADELRVDGRCRELLQRFHQWLLTQRQLPSVEAGALAAGTDYLLRDFLLDHCRENVLDLSARRLRQFGGTWYILKNLEPNLPELRRSLQGAAHFAVFAQELGLMTATAAAEIAEAAADEAWYASRIDSFHAITDDGYPAWERGCSLDDVGRVR